jgi:hypothetical protein
MCLVPLPVVRCIGKPKMSRKAAQPPHNDQGSTAIVPSDCLGTCDFNRTVSPEKPSRVRRRLARDMTTLTTRAGILVFADFAGASGQAIPCVTAQRAGRRNEPPEHQNQYSNMKLLSHVQ